MATTASREAGEHRRIQGLKRMEKAWLQWREAEASRVTQGAMSLYKADGKGGPRLRQAKGGSPV